MRPALSVIIVNYNAGGLLAACLRSLQAEPLQPEVIVVDNHSTDGSLQAAEGTPGVRVLRNASNLGFATACNQGLAVAQGEYLLFLNPDCEVQKGALATLLGSLAEEPQAALAGGLLVDRSGAEQAGARRAVPTPWRSFVRAFGLARFAPRWPRLFFDFHLHKSPLPPGPVEVEAISGACMMVRRSALDTLGTWDEGYFLHCEDLDWCMRARASGHIVLFVPGARVYHAVGGCSAERRLFVEWHKHCGMVRFYRKFFRHQYPGLLWVLVVMGVWLRFGLVTVHWFFRQITQRAAAAARA